MELKGKKILFVCSTDNMIWQFLTPHIDRLTELGGAVESACAETGFWFNELAGRGYAMHKIGFERSPFNMANRKAFADLDALIKSGGYDVIYCHQAVGGAAGRLKGKKYGCKVIYVAHGFFFWKGCPLKNKILYRTAERRLSKKTDALITMNEEDYAAAKEMKAKNVYFVHGAGISMRSASGAEIRREFGIKPDEKMVLTVSELIPRKNYPVMLRAISKVHGVKYVICGTGRDTGNMKSLAAELGISNRVFFAGYRRDIADIMNAADLFLHFAKQEGLPVAVAEAMSCGLPVVACDIRGCRDLITPDGGVLLPPAASSDRIAAEIKRLLSDPKLRQSMGENNKAISQKYRIENVLPEYDKVYEEL